MDETVNTGTVNPQPIELTQEAIFFLSSAAKWAKFLAIMGFIAIGFLVIAGLGAGILFNVMQSTMPSSLPFPPIVLSVLYIAIAALYLMPVIYMNNFSNKTTSAIQMQNTPLMTEALMNLKKWFKFTGVMTIVLIVIYILIFVGAGIFAVFAS